MKERIQELEFARDLLKTAQGDIAKSVYEKYFEMCQLELDRYMERGQ